MRLTRNSFSLASAVRLAAVVALAAMSVACFKSKDDAAPAGATTDTPTDPSKPATTTKTTTTTVTTTAKPTTAGPGVAVPVVGGAVNPPTAANNPPAATPPAATPPAATPPAATPPAGTPAATPTQTTAVTGRGVPPPPGGRPKPGSK